MSIAFKNTVNCLIFWQRTGVVSHFHPGIQGT